MTKDELILSTFSTKGNEIFSPVQIQKLLFLIDKKLHNELEGPYFDFKPYHYGPFDKGIYLRLDALHLLGKVDLIKNGRLTCYKLTNKGLEEGKKLFENLSEESKKKIKALTNFVKNLSFSELVSAIYKTYPEMKSNSIF